MLNLLFAAKEDDLQEAFAQAGWVGVEKSAPQIIWHLLWERKHYTKLPMDQLYVFGRSQDDSYALPDPTSIVARRHHLRIWRTDWVVDGIPLWVAAATHDVAIEFVKRKFRLSHRIDPNVDAERLHRDESGEDIATYTPTICALRRAGIQRANRHGADLLLRQQISFLGIEQGTFRNSRGNSRYR